MNTVCRVTMAIVILGLCVAQSMPASAKVLRYQTPFERPDGPQRADRNRGAGARGDVRGQEEQKTPMTPPVQSPGDDRSPQRFDSYEEKWYDRM